MQINDGNSCVKSQLRKRPKLTLTAVFKSYFVIKYNIIYEQKVFMAYGKQFKITFYLFIWFFLNTESIFNFQFY